MRDMTAESFESWAIPSPGNDAPKPESRIKALMLAILDDALRGLQSTSSAARAEARHWIVSREQRYVFSFTVICETLGLDPSAVRRSLIKTVGNQQTNRDPFRRSRPNVRHSGNIRPPTDRHRHSESSTARTSH